MPEIKLNMTNEQAARVSAAINGLYPIPRIPDPDFEGEEHLAPELPEFTNLQWFKLKIRDWLGHQVRRWEAKVAREEATPIENPDLIS